MSVPKRSHPLITPAVLAGRAYVYIRQSSASQVRENIGSTAVQSSLVEEAKEYGFTDIRVVTEDQGKSGATTQGRRGYQEMIGDIAVGVATAVFAVDVSRLARQVRDFATLLILCRSRGVVAVLDGRPINLNDPAEVAMAHVSAVFAEFNNAHRAATLRRARRAKAEMGHVVSQLPVGWIKRIDGSLDYDPEVAPAIRDVYAAFKETGSLRATAAALSGAGKALPARRYGRLKWVAPTADRVRSFLLNEAYGGDYIFGRTWSQPDPDNPGGRGIQVASPESEWIIKRGLLPRYVTPEEQRRFRERLQQNAFEKRHRPSGGRPLLHGLLECAICSGTLSVADPGERVGQHYYQCSRKR